MGIYEGIFINGAITAGEALVYGQLALAEIYPQNPNNNVYYFSTWNNLIGDPSTQLWTSRPIDLVVEHDDELINGSNSFQVSVTELFGGAYEGALVSLYKESNGNIQLQMNAYTNDVGIANFEIDNSIIVESNSMTVDVPIELDYKYWSEKWNDFFIQFLRNIPFIIF